VRNGVVGWLADRVAARRKAAARGVCHALIVWLLAVAICAPARAEEGGLDAASDWPDSAIVYGVDLFAFQPHAYATPRIWTLSRSLG
jgi:hypothetical protein